jgi:tRNA (guanine26-N2/guanine27-N2)-dimethyltransferase
MFPSTLTCPLCGERLQPIGPLWMGSLHNDATLAAMQERMKTAEPGSAKEIAKLLDTCRGELPTSSHYDYHVLAKRLGCSPPNIAVLLDRIREAGYPATRTHFSGYGIKTVAPLSVILDAIGTRT